MASNAPSQPRSSQPPQPPTVPPVMPPPPSPPPSPIQSAWTEFIASARALFAIQLEDRPLDQYLDFRDKVLRLVESPEFLKGLQTAWEVSTVTGSDGPSTLAPEVADALLAELRLFPRAVGVAKELNASNAGASGLLSRWLPRASTVAGSLEDLLDGLPPYVKGGLTLFKELCSLFKGKD